MSGEQSAGNHSDHNGPIRKSGLEYLFQFVFIIWGRRYRILRDVLIVALVSSAITFILPKKYSSRATILPDNLTLSFASKLGGLQDIASAVGLNSGTTSPSQLYPAMLLSESVLKNVIYHKYKTEKSDSLINLITYWGFDDVVESKNYDACLKLLRTGVITISSDKKTLLITLEVETTEPQLSADIANQLTTELDIFQQNFRQTNASSQRKFLEGRLNEVNRDLAKAEEKLTNFRENNRRVEQSPELLLQQTRLDRDVELNTAIFIELKKQYEIVKLDEIRDTPLIQVLDAARPSNEKISPKKRTIVAVFSLFGFLLSMLWNISLEGKNELGAFRMKIISSWKSSPRKIS